MAKSKALKNLEGILPDATEEQLEAISKLMEKQASELKNEHDEEVKNLRSQLDAANDQIKQFESMDIDKIKQTAAAWQEKFKASEKEWQTKLAGLRYEAAAKDAVADIKFTSNSAKKAFLADLKGMNLPLENDKLTGFSDFLENYKESDPGAFVTEAPEPSFKQVPGGQYRISMNTPPELDAAQQGFAERGVNFNSVKKFQNLMKVGGND